ncbi:hypothetical protein D9M68_482910 [compost metagenome]
MEGAPYVRYQAGYFTLPLADTTRQAAASAVQFDGDGQLLALHGFLVQIARRAIQNIAFIGRLQFQFVFEQRIEALGAGQPGEYQQRLVRQFRESLTGNGDGTIRKRRSATHANALPENGLVAAIDSQGLAILRAAHYARTQVASIWPKSYAGGVQPDIGSIRKYLSFI